MLKTNGGYHKDKKKIRFNNNTKTIFAGEGEEYAQIVKKEGQHRVVLEILNKEKVKTQVVGLIVGKLRKFACNKGDYVICVQGYSGSSGKEYGVIHKYKSSELDKLWTDKKFYFEKDFDTVGIEDEDEPDDEEVYVKQSRDDIAKEVMGSDSEDEDDKDQNKEEDGKKVVFVPSLDDL
jgi:hypothetical protein